MTANAATSVGVAIPSRMPPISMAGINSGSTAPIPASDIDRNEARGISGVPLRHARI